ELDQLFPKGPQPLGAEQRQKLGQLQKKQAGLQEQQRQLQQQMEQIGKKAPVFSPKMKQQMEGAGQQMEGAENAMAQRDANGSASRAGEAANGLERFQDDLKKSMKGGGGGGMSLPMPGGDD